jgi:transposase
LISLAPGTKVFLVCRPVDLRNGFDGLAAKAQQIIGADPFTLAMTLAAASPFPA